jgi:mRNA interferase RelE/StbE
MRIEWSDAARVSARRFMGDDQDGLRAVGHAVLALADDPCPAGAFHRGAYHRLPVGDYRILYYVDGDVITIERVDRSRNGVRPAGYSAPQAPAGNLSRSPSHGHGGDLPLRNPVTRSNGGSRSSAVRRWQRSRSVTGSRQK